MNTVQNAVLIAASVLFASSIRSRSRVCEVRWLLAEYPNPPVGEIVKHDTTCAGSATNQRQNGAA
jgi:hypothetical protein